MNSIYHRFTAFALALMLLLTPAISFAKNNENKSKGNEKNRITLNSDRDDDDEDDNDDRDDKKNKDERKSELKTTKKERGVCLRAFGHLIAPGYIKNKGAIDFPADCFLPFGIKKKFRGSASSTPDTIAPNISDVRVNPATTTARVTWDTNEKSDSTVFWSTVSSFSLTSTSTDSKVMSEMVKDHSVQIEGLTASTTYYLVVRSRDAASNTATSSERSFRTDSLPVDTTAPAISSIAYLSSTSTIAMSWLTNENATSRIYFSTTTPLNLTASTTQNLYSGALTQNHLLTATGLTASTTYYFAVESVDPSGNKTTSPSFTLLTQ